MEETGRDGAQPREQRRSSLGEQGKGQSSLVLSWTAAAGEWAEFGDGGVSSSACPLELGAATAAKAMVDGGVSQVESFPAAEGSSSSAHHKGFGGGMTAEYRCYGEQESRVSVSVSRMRGFCKFCKPMGGQKLRKGTSHLRVW